MKKSYIASKFLLAAMALTAAGTGLGWSRPASALAAAASETEAEGESVLTSQDWFWEGYRFSDTWLYRFYPDGTYRAVSAAGLADMEGTYTFDGEELVLFDREGTMSDTLRYDGDIFTSSLRQVYTGDDYVDAAGVYHEKPSRWGTLETPPQEYDWLKITEDGEEVTVDEQGYILPESDTRLYTADELAGFSDWELTLARNEIYARHGRLFDTPEIQEYFDGCSWYEGTITPEEFTGHEEEYLNPIELENVQMIYDYQGQPKL